MSVVAVPEQAKSSGGVDEPPFYRWLLGKIAPLLGLAAVYAFFAVAKPGAFMTLPNSKLILEEMALNGLAALGTTLVIISGGIDLSIGPVVALCSVVVALLILHGWPIILAVFAAVATGALCGALNGLIITAFNLLPFIVTLGAWSALRGAAQGLCHSQSVNANAGWLANLLNTPSGNWKWLPLPLGVWLIFIVTAALWALLRYTRFGRHVFAIGSNEQTARLCGVRVRTSKIWVYAIASAMAGLAGVMNFAWMSGVGKSTLSYITLPAIASVVVGGASLSGGEGSPVGTLIGVLIIAIVSNGCGVMDLSNWVQKVVTGAIIIVAVALDRLRRRRAR